MTEEDEVSNGRKRIMLFTVDEIKEASADPLEEGLTHDEVWTDKDELKAIKERKYREIGEINNIKKLLEEEVQIPASDSFASKRGILGDGHHYNALKKIVEKSRATVNK